MTGPELATLRTLAWAVATGALFVLLANWSAGGSWGIVSGLVDGVRGWASDEERRVRPISSTGVLPALDMTAVVRPRDLDRPGVLPQRNPAEPLSEIEDFGSRSLDR